MNLDRSGVSFVIHARLGIQAGIVPSLYKVQALWRETRDYTRERLDKPMRATLVLCLFKEVLSRVEHLPNDYAALKEFCNNGWLSQDGGFWPFLVWDAESKSEGLSRASHGCVEGTNPGGGSTLPSGQGIGAISSHASHGKINVWRNSGLLTTDRSLP